MLKAFREAKVNTSWNDTDTSYVEAVRGFVAAILEGPDTEPFLGDFLTFQARVARVGIVHSLSQTLLKLDLSRRARHLSGPATSWDFQPSLVDPDNRRPVDYGRRRRS